jgi:hypothetical protein
VIDVLKEDEDVVLSKEDFQRIKSEFEQTVADVGAARAWEAGEITGTEAMARSGMKGMQIKPIGLVQPIFTQFAESSYSLQSAVVRVLRAEASISAISNRSQQPEVKAEPTGKPMRPDIVFFENHEMLAFPVNKSHAMAVDGAAATMSIVHFLIIPKQRIYNAVTLTENHVPMLQRMIDRAKALLKDTYFQRYCPYSSNVLCSYCPYSSNVLCSPLLSHLAV